MCKRSGNVFADGCECAVIVEVKSRVIVVVVLVEFAAVQLVAVVGGSHGGTVAAGVGSMTVVESAGGPEVRYLGEARADLGEPGKDHQEL